MRPKSFVERALAVAFQIQRDVSEARGFQVFRDDGGHFRRERSLQFFRGNFDAREFVDALFATDDSGEQSASGSYAA